ncbi:protein phosphatase 2C domain-containing protein [Cronobacter sakazakii]|uniref:protein phosphatase 2C domain-containing protein n=1 Tax=Cronobacter phage phiES15 TaxID=1168280 RepID=UPI00025F67C9|nr:MULTISPECIES: protein phosphatase 2C domain-containing protein [Cronobacter]YP_006590027.1 protein phosphatase 2C domain-containing protein [Cronobacter phage phiES15]AFH14944.1 putative serine/threonine phosphatase [Cronobacter phage phiES15]AFJ98453.1 putative serine/threonine phosphatase [Cronobacter sakazakii ES15]EJT7705357.1 protein phosphatase 2C domain-containing protein [Cronobacter sakazakii]ELY2518342.1 protein phosphatase 2C domain-containing protein [Cronobacter sakazakii]ELY3
MIDLLSCGAFSFAKDHFRQNEDAFLLPKSSGNGYLFAIADGVGSYAGANEAAQTAINSLSAIEYPEFLEPELVLNNIKNKLTEAAEKKPDEAKAATTLSYCFINSDYVYIVHVGDTRIYARIGLKLQLLTKDHTQHQELLDDGLYTRKELKSLPGKNKLTAAISKTLPVHYQFLKIPLDELADEDGALMLVIMSDGAHSFWEHRPRFSVTTMNNANNFAANMHKRIQRLGPNDDHSLIAASFKRILV